MANINDASNAYLNTVKQLQNAGNGQQAGDSAKADGIPSFGEILNQSGQSAINA